MGRVVLFGRGCVDVVKGTGGFVWVESGHVEERQLTDVDLYEWLPGLGNVWVWWENVVDLQVPVVWWLVALRQVAVREAWQGEEAHLHEFQLQYRDPTMRTKLRWQFQNLELNESVMDVSEAVRNGDKSFPNQGVIPVVRFVRIKVGCVTLSRD